MDDATVDADLFGDPSSNAFSDQLLGNEEALVEEAAAAAAERRRASESQTHPGEPLWRTSRRIVKTDVCEMVDLRALEYVEVVDENLHCPICHSPLVAPVKLGCDHVFCDDCLRNAMEHQSETGKSCPSCRGRTNLQSIQPVTKIVSRILDGLKVRCPIRGNGCEEILPRGSVQDHVDLYCAFGETDCSASQCDLKVQRRFSEGPCLHGLIACLNCSKEVMERDLDSHRRQSCDASYIKCSDCQDWITLSQADAHSQECPEAVICCNASPYGCDYTSKRTQIDAHLSTCPLNKLSPFLETQKSRLEDHEAALQHLKRKNAIYEEGLANVQTTLHDSLIPPLSLSPPNPNADSTSADPVTHPPFDSTTHQLLDLHDTLQNEVMHIKNSIADLDAKMEMTVLNQTLRANEEKLHRDAIDNQMRKQLQWLVSSRLQNYQRSAAMVRAQSEAGPSAMNGGKGGEGGGGQGDVGNIGGVSADAEAVLEKWRPRRRSSDSGRQETKL
ncbi:MAG: hypothetical protein MMC23_006359 [Stictis urceolatum]|nr:hypothetical protein [Stictis urceolata]